MSATVEITFKCGHVEDRDLSAKPAGERRRYAEWLSSTACRSCWQRSSKRTQSKEFKARAEQEVQAALEDQKKMDFASRSTCSRVRKSRFDGCFFGNRMLSAGLSKMRRSRTADLRAPARSP